MFSVDIASKWYTHSSILHGNRIFINSWAMGSGLAKYIQSEVWREDNRMSREVLLWNRCGLGGCFVSQVNTHQTTSNIEEALNNQENSTTRTGDIK